MTPIKITTVVDKNEDFIEWQYKSIKKFVKGNDVEYIVFNNANNDNQREKINNICNNLKIKVIDLYVNYSLDFSQIHAEAMNQMWQHLKNENGFLFHFDSDMFFVSEINFEQIGKNYDVSYIPQYRDNFNVKYMWAGIFFLNLNTINKNIDFSICYNGDKTDSGGATQYFLQNNYIELYSKFCTIMDFDENKLDTSLNGCTEFIKFTNNVPDKKYCDTRFFPHEKENINYLEDYRLEYDKHKELVNKYSFPKPYIFDLIKFDGEKDYFIFHYKSANWLDRYGNGLSDHATTKKESLKKMLIDLGV